MEYLTELCDKLYVHRINETKTNTFQMNNFYLTEIKIKLYT